MSERMERGKEKYARESRERERKHREKEVRDGERQKDGESENNEQKEEVKMRKKMLILLSHFCKEPPGVCVSARAYCCCREKTLSQKLQLKDYLICSEKILLLLGTYQTLWINKKCKVANLKRRVFFVCLEY